jgi:hypothetical protein
MMSLRSIATPAAGSIALLTVIAILTGCGGGGATTTLLSACGRGINVAKGQTGECVEYPGLRLAAVSRHSTLHLTTLSARVLETRTARSFSVPQVHAAIARGLYLVIGLKITNLTDSPRSFNTNHATSTTQTQLIVGRNTYNDAFKAENTVDPHSFLTQASRLIKPHESRTGDVIFDLPPAVARGIAAGKAKEAGLAISNFGTTLPTAGPPNSLNPTDTGGFIQLSH